MTHDRIEREADEAYERYWVIAGHSAYDRVMHLEAWHRAWRAGIASERAMARGNDMTTHTDPPNQDWIAERLLRTLLAIKVSGWGLYRDDGKLQDNSEMPCIDFKRDSVELIRAKLADRAARAAPPADGPKRLHEQRGELQSLPSLPIDMILHCPACGLQHVDGPEVTVNKCIYSDPDWTNPPHRSHLCDDCGHIWRPADVATNGVVAIKTSGKADSIQTERADRAARAAPPADGPVLEALRELHTVLGNRHHGRMPDEVAAAYDKAGDLLRRHAPKEKS